MDAVHNPDSHSWIGEKINLNEYFTKYQELVYSTRSASAKKGGDLKILSAKNIKKIVETVQDLNEDKEATPGIDKDKDQLDDQLYDKIETLCDIDNLTIPNEVSPMQQFLDPAQSNREAAERQVQSTQHPKFQVKYILIQLNIIFWGVSQIICNESFFNNIQWYFYVFL